MSEAQKPDSFPDEIGPYHRDINGTATDVLNLQNAQNAGQSAITFLPLQIDFKDQTLIF